VRGGLIAGLADARIEPEVADELVGVREAADVADRGQERCRDDQVEDRDGHRPADLRPLHGLQRDEPVDLGDLAVEERDLAQPGVDGLALLGRQLELAQPRLAFAAERVAGRRAALQAAHQNGVDLGLDARAGADQLTAPGQSSAHRADRLVGHPHRVERPGRQQLGQRQRVEAVGLRARLADPGVGGADHHHAGDVRLEIRAIPRVAGHLQHRRGRSAPGSGRTAAGLPACSGPGRGPGRRDR
jgi:hypothetical protein